MSTKIFTIVAADTGKHVYSYIAHDRAVDEGLRIFGNLDMFSVKESRLDEELVDYELSKEGGESWASQF